MKKNSQRKPKPRLPLRPGGAPAGGHASGAEAAHAPSHGHEERKMGIATGTHADAFDEAQEQKHNKWIAIFISVLAVLIAFADIGNTDAMKVAQQAGIQVNDNYAFYQAKVIRQSQLKVAADQMELKVADTPNMPEPARKIVEAKKADYDKEIVRLEFNRRNGKKELLARAEDCENLRNAALAEHPFFDYSGAALHIAIVLASASIVTGAMFLVWISGAVGVLGIVLFLNGHFMVYGAPHEAHEKFQALERSLPLMHKWEAPKIAKCPLE